MTLALLYRRSCHLSCRGPFTPPLALSNGQCTSPSPPPRSCHAHSFIRSQSSRNNQPVKEKDPRDILFPIQDEETFSHTGFWPSPDPSEQQQLESSNRKFPAQAAATFFTPLLPGQRIKKYDLCNPDATQPPGQTSIRIPSVPFRAGVGLRQILVDYITKIDPLLRDGQPPGQEHQLQREIATVFSDRNTRYLQDRNYQPADVVAWAWIVTAPRVSQAVRRYVILTDVLLKHGKPLLPRFIALQMLRVDYMNATSFTSLLSTFNREADEKATRNDDLDPTIVFDAGSKDLSAQTREWRYRSPMVLTVRLLRHARNVAPATFDDIAQLCSKLLLPLREDNAKGLERLTFICNRILTLISLPCQVKPFRSAKQQQRGQLTLLRCMMVQEPQIPITREGYRALIKVQLLHQKTEEEKDWARAKSESWPPWRAIKMGIDRRMERLGEESRAKKLLRRMTEAGYAHMEWEKTASVLAGWDVDKSPTIQTRQILDMPSMTEISFGGAHITADLWAARVRATRSVREAWACFTSYRKSIQDSDKRVQPYEAMFEKLLASPHRTRVYGEILPGDTKDLFADPTSERELVYLEEDLPSAKDFYTLMIDDEVRPAGRLLSLLVRNAHTIEEATKYLSNSQYGEVRRDVLLHAYKYPEAIIRDVLVAVPGHFFVAFLDFLFTSAATKFRTSSQRPGAFGLNFDLTKIRITKPDHYALALLFLSQSTYLPAYTSALFGILLQVRGRTYRKLSGRPSKAAWFMTGKILSQMEDLDTEPDWATFYNFGSIVRCYLRPPPMPWVPQISSVQSRIKKLFMNTVYGYGSPEWIKTDKEAQLQKIPDPAHLRVVIEVLGVTQDLKGIVQLLAWMAEHTVDLQRTYLELTTGENQMRRALLVACLFLDGGWAHHRDEDGESPPASSEQSEQIGKDLKAAGLPWPSTAELADFVQVEENWVGRIQSEIWNMKRVASKQALAADTKKAEADRVAMEETGERPE